VNFLPTTRGARALACGGLVIAALYLAAMEVFRKPDGRVIFGDATHHYVQLRSLVFDGDLNFENDYLGIYGVEAGDPGTEWLEFAKTPTGLVRNYMPVGPALAWAPAYLIVSAVLWILALVGLAPAPDGFDRALQLVPGLTGIAIATFATIGAWRMTQRFVPDRTAAIAAWAVWIGSHAIYYTLVSPTYSHAASMGATTLFFSHWLSTRTKPAVGSIAASGALAGLAALMRWQDAILLSVPILEALRWRGPIGSRIGALAAATGTFVAVFSAQMAIWTVLYGQPLAVPQGPAFLQWTSPHPIAVLFSDNHGLFTWAPLLVPAVIGLGMLMRRERELALPLAVVMAASWYINSAVVDWWAGEAFGARRFLSLFPLFIVGLGIWLGARPERWRLSLISALLVANLLLLLQYQVFMKGLTTVAPYPAFWFDMFAARLVVPFRLLQLWMSG
jgi:hypothetical protein